MEIYKWYNLKREEISSYGKRIKLKWLGTPSQFGWVFLELAKKGYVETPKTGGQDSYAKYARICNDLFDIKTTPANLEKELNPRSNSLTLANREEIKISPISSLSKSN